MSTEVGSESVTADLTEYHLHEIPTAISLAYLVQLQLGCWHLLTP